MILNLLINLKLFLFFKKTKMQRNLSNDQKAQVYNSLLAKFQRLQEQVRLIKAENFELNAKQAKEVQMLEAEMRRVYNETQKLF